MCTLRLCISTYQQFLSRFGPFLATTTGQVQVNITSLPNRTFVDEWYDLRPRSKDKAAYGSIRIRAKFQVQKWSSFRRLYLVLSPLSFRACMSWWYVHFGCSCGVNTFRFALCTNRVPAWENLHFSATILVSEELNWNITSLGALLALTEKMYPYVAFVKPWLNWCFTFSLFFSAARCYFARGGVPTTSRRKSLMRRFLVSPTQAAKALFFSFAVPSPILWVTIMRYISLYAIYFTICDIFLSAMTTATCNMSHQQRKCLCSRFFKFRGILDNDHVICNKWHVCDYVVVMSMLPWYFTVVQLLSCVFIFVAAIAVVTECVVG